MAWRALAYADSVASLTNTEPVAVDGSAAAVGDGTEAARDNHVHALGPLVSDLDFDGNQALSFVLEAVGTAPDSGAEVEGQMYYDTGDDNVYVWNA